ncbi:site-specific integrase [Micromonospora inyonensis]|uniref:site-specific integrase n=1 Tax=Micromonospora inyonensis TaxID=47866 RepID=UPI001FDF3806|nr:site-specific integrase [Micromonospora inyonensis]
MSWQIGAAMLLSWMLAGRAGRPVFLADGKPARAVATVDLRPVTGRAWMSYRRAAEIFEHATCSLADPVDRAQGFTLRQLRHTMLTYEAENGTNTATLLARSRHASVRSLERHARPGTEAVAAHVTATDLASKRRTGQR